MITPVKWHMWLVYVVVVVVNEESGCCMQTCVYICSHVDVCVSMYAHITWLIFLFGCICVSVLLLFLQELHAYMSGVHCCIYKLPQVQSSTAATFHKLPATETCFWVSSTTLALSCCKFLTACCKFTFKLFALYIVSVWLKIYWIFCKFLKLKLQIKLFKNSEKLVNPFFIRIRLYSFK